MTQYTLKWSIRPSFLTYLQNSGGVIEALEPARVQGGVLEFPAVASTEGGYESSGTVLFKAHGGLLNLEISDLSVTSQEGEAQLVNRVGGQASVFARGTWVSASKSKAIVPKLTYLGTRLFGDVYRVGEEMGEITMEASGGAQP